MKSIKTFRRIIMLLYFAGLGSTFAQGLPLTSVTSVASEDIVWKSFPAFPPKVKLAILVGNPAKAEPFVVRVKVPNGERILPHMHPEDRIYTVISGVFYIGIGTEFNEAGLKAYPPGSVVVLPGNTPHFHFAKSGEYITQVYAVGPLGLDYVDKESDPRLQAGH
jgi:quercetin dioxygenase-like cupin family protein